MIMQDTVISATGMHLASRKNASTNLTPANLKSPKLLIYFHGLCTSSLYAGDKIAKI